jgi:hypothetical protein
MYSTISMKTTSTVDEMILYVVKKSVEDTLSITLMSAPLLCRITSDSEIRHDIKRPKDVILRDFGNAGKNLSTEEGAPLIVPNRKSFTMQRHVIMVTI